MDELPRPSGVFRRIKEKKDIFRLQEKSQIEFMNCPGLQAGDQSILE